MATSPTGEAARLRREAEAADPERRAYLLWLAAEWDKSAARPAASDRARLGE